MTARRVSRRFALAGLGSDGTAAALALFARPSTRGMAIAAAAAAEVPLLRIGGQLAYVAMDGQIWALRGDRHVRLTDCPDRRAHDPRWSPDGSEIAYLAYPTEQPGNARDRRDDLYLVSADGGRPRQVTHRASPMFDLSWFPDGGKLLYGNRSGADVADDFRINAVNRDGGGGLTFPPATSIPSHSEQAGAASPDGSLVAYIQLAYGTALRVFLVVTDASAGDGRRLVDFTQERGRPFDLVWTPDGSSLAFAIGSQLQELRVGDRERRTVAEVGDGNRIAASPLAYAPDGSALAFGFDDAARARTGAFRHLLIVGRDGAEIGRISRPDAARWSRVQWTADGSAILYAVGPSDDPAEPRTLFVANRDGSSVEPVLDVAGGDAFDWRP